MTIAWHPDPEFWSANRAEHAFVGSYELVAFDLPANNGFDREIGWELFGGIERMEQLDTGRGTSFAEARQAAEKALLKHLLTRSEAYDGRTYTGDHLSRLGLVLSDV